MASLLGLLAALPVRAQQLDWVRNFALDGASWTRPDAMATDASGLYVTGALYDRTTSRFYIRKYDFEGRLSWTRTSGIGTGINEYLRDIATDGSAVYAAGSAGAKALVAGFDRAGRLLWRREFGPFAGAREAALTSIAVHDSGIYVGGYQYFESGSSQGFLIRLDRAGNTVWPAPKFLAAPDIVLDTAADDSGLYVSQDSRRGGTLRFDFNGNQTGSFASTGPLALDASGVYIGAAKYARNGRLLWKRLIAAANVAVDSTGLYLFWNHAGEGPPGRERRYRVTKLDRDGHDLWTGLFGTELGYGSAATARAGKAYIASTLWSGSGKRAYAAAISQDLPAQLQTLRDLGVAPAAYRLAVLEHDSRTPLVSALVKDARSGAQVRRITFDASYWPRQMIQVPDANRNGSEDLALLGTHRTTGAAAAELRDGRTGAFIGRVLFDPARAGQSPRKLAALADENGNGIPELALLGTFEYSGGFGPRVILEAEVRDAGTGALIREGGYNAFYQQLDTEFEFNAVPDTDGNGFAELATLTLEYYSTFYAQDAGLTPVQVTFHSPFTEAPLQQALLPDGNGDGLNEAALWIRDTTGVENVRVYQGYNIGMIPEPVRVIDFDTAGELQEMLAVPDLNASGYPELAVLRTNARPGQGVIEVKDGRSGTLIGKHAYASRGFSFRGLALSDDLNGNGSAEFVVLQQRRSDRALQALIVDARSGALIRTIGF